MCSEPSRNSQRGHPRALHSTSRGNTDGTRRRRLGETAWRTIENISDTARWVAVYRAMETERRDAIFRDPYAGRLAGDKGQAIVDE